MSSYPCKIKFITLKIPRKKTLKLPHSCGPWPCYIFTFGSVKKQNKTNK